jgi:hypothetical protein
MAESIEHQMTEIYCFVDDYLRARPALSGWRQAFPRLPSYAQWVNRLHRLSPQIGELLPATAAMTPRAPVCI